MKKIINIVVMFIVFLLLFSAVPVLAKSKIDFGVSISQGEIKSGQILKVTLKLDQYVEDDFGINAYKAKLDYDKNIFEELSKDDFLCQNYWGNLQYNKVTGDFISIRSDNSKNLEDILVISFKVRNDVDVGTTEIKLKDIVASGGREDLFINDKVVEVNVINDYGIDHKKLSDSKIIHLNNSSTTEKIVEDSYVKEISDVTGNFKDVKFNEMIFIIILLLVIIIYVIIRKFRDDDYYYDDYNNKKIFAFIVALLVFLQGFIVCSSLYYKFWQKGELNDDGVIDYLDVDSLEYHLTQIISLDDNVLANADINNDKSITITDLSRFVKEIDDNLISEVSLFTVESEEDKFFSKDQDIDLTFIAGVRNDFNIVEVVINGSKYKVDKISDNKSEYLVKVNTGDSVGIKKYHFTEIILDNGNRLAVDYVSKIKVLKDTFRIDNYITEEFVDEKKINLSFNLIDNDDTIYSSVIRVEDDVGNIIDTRSIKKGKNSISISVKDEKLYKVKFILKYDLDINESSSSDGRYKNVVQIVKKLQLVGDYQFSIDNIVITNDEDTTDIFEKGQSLKLSFSSVNASQYFVERVIVNGKDYEVKKDGNVYSTTLFQLDKLGQQDIFIEGVLLDNGKKIIFNEKKKISVNVIKRKASILDFSAEENIELSKLLIKAQLKDKDNSIYKIRLLLLNDKGELIDSKDVITKELSNGEIDVSLCTNFSSKYKVKIIGFYDPIENNNIVLFEKEVEAKTQVNILDIFSDELDEETTDFLILNYSIIHNRDVSISKICIDGIFYEVSSVNDLLYKVFIPIEDKGDTYQLITTNILFDDGSLANVKKTINLEYLDGIYSIKYSKLKSSFMDFQGIDSNFNYYELRDVENLGKFINNLKFIREQSPNEFVNKLKNNSSLVSNSLIDKDKIDNSNLSENISILSKCLTKILFPSRAGPLDNKSIVEYFGLVDLCNLEEKDNCLDKDLYIRNIVAVSYYNVPISISFYSNYINNMSHIFDNLINRLRYDDFLDTKVIVNSV